MHLARILKSYKPERAAEFQKHAELAIRTPRPPRLPVPASIAADP